MSNKWSDNLRKRMETHQEPSPEGLWENIEHKLQHNISNLPRRKQNGLRLWSKCIGATAVALIMLFIGDYFLREDLLKPIAQDKETPFNFKEKLSALSCSNLPPLAKNKRVVSKIKTYKGSILPKEKDDSNLIAKFEETLEKAKVIESYDSQTCSNVKVDKRRVLSNEFCLDTNRSALKNHFKLSKLGTSLYFSNLPLNTSKQFEGYVSYNPREDPPEVENVYTDVKHRQPVTIGVSLNYNLNEKWSIASGLTFTILSSKFRSGSDSYFYMSDQTLHNIGIPLSVSYNLLKNKRISVYLAAGGLVEKSVYGNLTTDYIVDNKFQQRKEDNISVDQLQWSLNTSTGVLYSLSKKVGLYAEPGVSYYFNNGSEVETIYKEKPINFSLRFGIHISLGK